MIGAGLDNGYIAPREDILAELVHIGNGAAITALSRMCRGLRLRADVPEWLNAGAIDGVPWASQAGLIVALGLHGPCWGAYVVLLPGDMGDRIARQLLGPLAGQSGRAAVSMVESALAELGNIAACAFLGSVCQLTGGEWIPTPPELMRGALGDGVRGALAGAAEGVVVSTHFHSDDESLSGRLVYATDGGGADTLLRAVSSRWPRR